MGKKGEGENQSGCEPLNLERGSSVNGVSFDATDLKTAELPALCNVFSSIYQLFVHIILLCPYLCVFIYNWHINKYQNSSFEFSIFSSHVC